MISSDVREQLRSIVGETGLLDRPQDLTLYEYDGSVDTHAPDCVVFPRSTEEVARLVKVAAEHHLPLVGRGAGTGLSGGVIPIEGGFRAAGTITRPTRRARRLARLAAMSPKTPAARTRWLTA